MMHEVLSTHVQHLACRLSKAFYMGITDSGMGTQWGLYYHWLETKFATFCLLKNTSPLLSLKPLWHRA